MCSQFSEYVFKLFAKSSIPKASTQSDVMNAKPLIPVASEIGDLDK